MSPEQFVAMLSHAKMPSVFNPWRDRCKIHDLPDAPIIRQQNLRRFLQAALDTRAKTMWIARDLGYRGGRRTGVPLTDEIHLNAASELMGGIHLDRATGGLPVSERTAAVIWSVLTQVRQPVVLWNVFPFHPHEDGDPMSNRCHTKSERSETWPLLEALISMIRPESIVAIGRDANMALSELGVKTMSIRHPSYGGQTEFISGMHDFYGVDIGNSPNQLTLEFKTQDLEILKQPIAVG